MAESAEDELLDLVGDARLVLLGEATHGTHEFYSERAAITRRLIAERGFAAVAVEADWPDAHRVNRFVRGVGEDADADSALGDFRRFRRLDVAQHGGARLRRLAARAQRRAATGAARRLLRARPLQPACVDRGRPAVPRAHLEPEAGRVSAGEAPETYPTAL